MSKNDLVKVRITKSTAVDFPYGQISKANKEFIEKSIGMEFVAELRNQNYYELSNGMMVHIYNAVEVGSYDDFTWGEVIERFNLNMDGTNLSIVKYHPWTRKGIIVQTGYPAFDETLYHVEELSESFPVFELAVIAWIARQKVGIGQFGLVTGIGKALNIV